MRFLILIISIISPLVVLSQTYVDSLLVLERRVFESPNSVEALLDKARFQKSNKNFKEAIATLNRAKPTKASDSLKAQYYYELCLLYVLSNNTLAANGTLYDLKQYSSSRNSELLE